VIEALLAKARSKLQRHVTDIEVRTDLTEDQKVSQIVVVFSTVCAAIAVQPIPFADIFILTPLQAFMGTRIAAIRGLRLSQQEATEVIKEIMGFVGMGLIAQQLGIAAAKILFPIFGGVATVPVVFGLTFAIGKVMDAYFINKIAGRKMTADEIRNIWKKAKEAGTREGKQREKEVRRDGLD